MAEERLGRELSASQLDFIKIQHRKNELAAVGKKRKRSTEEDAEFKKLQKKLNNSRSSFMRDLRDGNVEEDVIAAASRANIFVD